MDKLFPNLTITKTRSINGIETFKATHKNGELFIFTQPSGIALSTMNRSRLKYFNQYGTFEGY